MNLMSIMNMFLLAEGDGANNGTALNDWQDKIINAVHNILVPLLVIACSIGIIYAVVIGIKMVRADNKNDRDENKARLVNIAISIVATAILIGLFYALRSWLMDEANPSSDLGGIFDEIPDGHIGGNLLNTFNLAKQCMSMWL